MNQCVSNHQELTIPIVSYKQRIIACTGISEKMYKTIVKESKPAGASTSFSTPRKKRPQQKRHELVEAERHAVKVQIHDEIFSCNFGLMIQKFHEQLAGDNISCYMIQCFMSLTSVSTMKFSCS
jgi:hypothetical protein